MQAEKAGNYLREREMCNLPLRQPPQQHNKVIKSDSFACYFSDDIYPSFSMHLHSLPTCQSLHPSHIPPAPRPESGINYLTRPFFPPLELLTLLLFSIYHEYEIHDVDYIPDYRTAVFLSQCEL